MAAERRLHVRQPGRRERSAAHHTLARKAHNPPGPLPSLPEVCLPMPTAIAEYQTRQRVDEEFPDPALHCALYSYRLYRRERAARCRWSDRTWRLRQLVPRRGSPPAPRRPRAAASIGRPLDNRHTRESAPLFRLPHRRGDGRQGWKCLFRRSRPLEARVPPRIAVNGLIIH